MKHVCMLLSFLLAASLSAEDGVHRYLYCASPDGAQTKSGSGTGIVVFDIDNDFKFVKRIEIPTFKSGIRGLTGNLVNHALYYSTSNKELGCYDIEADKVVWEQRYETGCDRSCVIPDGSKIYAPCGFWDMRPEAGFLVIDAKSGKLLKELSGGKGPHNSIASLDGTRVYLGSTTKLTVYDPRTDTLVKEIPDVGEAGVFPYTVDSKNRYAYVCLGKHVGVDVVDLEQGKAIHRVMANADAPISHRTHGAALTPDESELWISDQDGKKLFIFDATQMPPKQTGHIDLSVGGHGWINFSLDGKFAWCHTPDVFATLKDENGKLFSSSKLIEAHIKDGKVVKMSSEFGLGRPK
jgi:DNA-binding beta-propeller fold protein YncE